MEMKKMTFWAVGMIALMMTSVPVKAQSLKDLLGKATEVVQAVTGADSVKMVGNWTYSGSSIEFESDNLLSKAGGGVAANAAEKKLDEYLTKVGIKAGNTKFAFAQDSTLTISWNGKVKKGTYSYDASTKKVTLKFGKLLTISPKLTAKSSELDLLFEADKLLKLITYITSKSGNATLQSISSLANNYDGMLLGLALKKE